MPEETRSLQETQQKEAIEEGAERTRERAAFVPRVDIFEHEDAIMLFADMPGVDGDALDITLEKNVLTINGYVEPTSPEGYSLAYAEYRIGDYQRSFQLSNEIDQDNIEATLQDGVLRLRLPKAEPRTRKITVQAG
jgi:HSP20 family molecular chaperone IbpA